MPPSPSLSARSTYATYLTDTTTTSAQNTSEHAPTTFDVVTGRWWPCEPWNVSRSAYSGLVPMSPNTTPSAPTVSAAAPADDLAPLLTDSRWGCVRGRPAAARRARPGPGRSMLRPPRREHVRNRHAPRLVVLPVEDLDPHHELPRTTAPAAAQHRRPGAHGARPALGQVVQRDVGDLGAHSVGWVAVGRAGDRQRGRLDHRGDDPAVDRAERVADVAADRGDGHASGRVHDAAADRVPQGAVGAEGRAVRIGEREPRARLRRRWLVGRRRRPPRPGEGRHPLAEQLGRDPVDRAQLDRRRGPARPQQVALQLQLARQQRPGEVEGDAGGGDPVG